MYEFQRHRLAPFLKRAALAALLFLAACHPAHQSPQAGQSQAPFSVEGFPGTYQGVLPCPNCEGIRTTITFAADHQFQMQEIYLGRSTLVFHSSGRWTFDPSGNQLRLDSSRRSYTQTFTGLSANQIAELDRQGRRLASPGHNDILSRMQ
ncbi:MAG: copper resistance protein NlpE [Stenotrophobium sp.]